MKKLIGLLIFWLSQAAFGLQAPYLYSADSVADTAIQLTWRNNSAAYLGIIVLRKADAADQYGVIDTAPGSATSFTDTVRPPSRTTYYYALTAFSQTEHADTSNQDSASITPPKPAPIDSIFVAPYFSAGWDTWDTLSHIVYMGFFDSSNVETGYRIYRSTNFGPFEIIKDFPSSTPSQEGIFLRDTDTTVSYNTWYMYYVVAYMGQKTLISNIDTVFALDINAMKRDAPKKCSLLDKICSFPIKYGSWSLKSGDTIVLNESSAPDSTFSIIDVSNPSGPRFAGTGKSGAAAILHYSNGNSLTYAYTKGDYVFAASGNYLSCYKYHLGTMLALSTIDVGRTVFPPCGFLSDTILIVPNWKTDSITEDSYLWAGEVLFKNNILSYSKEELIYYLRCGYIYCGYGSDLVSGVIFHGILFTEFNAYTEVVDFNYPVPPILYLNEHYPWSNLVFYMSLLSNGISLDAPGLSASRAVLVDTVKNLIFALSDSELSIYNCQIVAGVSHPASTARYAGQFLHVAKGKDGFASLIFLPQHFQPCAVSIYDLSGRRVGRMEGIRGETVAWPHQNRAGVYIIKALLDGKSVTAKVILSQ